MPGGRSNTATAPAFPAGMNAPACAPSLAGSAHSAMPNRWATGAAKRSAMLPSCTETSASVANSPGTNCGSGSSQLEFTASAYGKTRTGNVRPAMNVIATLRSM